MILLLVVRLVLMLQRGWRCWLLGGGWTELLQLLLLVDWLAALNYLRYTSRLRMLQFRLVQRCSSDRVCLLLTEVLGLLGLRLGRRHELLLLLRLLLEMIVLRVTVLR